MSYIELHTVALLTDASGDFTGFTKVVKGRVVQYRYIPDGSTPLATGADLDITGEITGVVIANQDNIGTVAFTKAPRQPVHDEAGVASLYAGAGEPVETPVVVAEERLQVVIDQGGNVLSGTLYLWVE